MSRRPKPLMHAKQRRPQSRFFGNLTPDDIHHHDRKLADLRRAEGVNDTSLDVVARRLADAFPKEIDVGPYLAAVNAFLDLPANTIHKLKGRSTRQQRHQTALRLLRAITIEGETREDYCERTGLDTGDASRMLEHLCSKDQELRCAVEFIGAHGTGTSAQNRQPDVSGCYDINVGKTTDGVVLTPAVRLGIKTPQGIKALVFPNAKYIESADATGTSLDFRQPGHDHGLNFENAARVFTTQVGDTTWIMLCRDEPPKDWGGIEGVFKPGNEIVTVGKDDDDRVGVHSLSRDGKWSEEIADTGDPGIQRPGETWVRVGPRAVVEARKGDNELQANTVTPPTFSASPCRCTTCAGLPRLTWRVAISDWDRSRQRFRLVETPQLRGLGHDCRSLQIRRDARWRGRQWKAWLPWAPGPKVPAVNGWSCDAFAPLQQVINIEPRPAVRYEGQCRLLTPEHMYGKPLLDGRDYGLKNQPSELFQVPGEMDAARQRLGRMSSWHWWIASNDAAWLKHSTK